MATYTPIADNELLADAPYTTSLAFRMRDNPEAVVEGNATKKIASGAFADNTISGAKLADNTTSGAKLTANSVSADKLQDGTVSAVKLNLGNANINTGTVGNGATVNINLPRYVLNWRLETGGPGWRITGFNLSSGDYTQPGFVLINETGGSSSAIVHYQYFL